ncbi:MAG: heavy metal-binding domain-containing protein [Chloroflexota bacterium]
MGFLRRLGNPITGEKSLPNPRSDIFRTITYRQMASNQGLPMVGLNLTGARVVGSTGPALVSNPTMTLAVLLDRSGSMDEAYRSGHVLNAASTILSYVAAAGVGYDLVFYNHSPSFAGHIRTEFELQGAIRQNQPTGGTQVLEALQGAIKRYRERSGIYMIVITDGEFSDKTQVQAYVVNALLPQLTPSNPYAVRLHFVGAGEGVDKEFLEQLEQAATGQGVQLVKAHHHAHLRHSHDSMLDELDGAFLGYGTEVFLGERSPDQATPAVVSRVGNLDTNQWVEGRFCNLGFVPRRARLGIEFGAEHPVELDAALRIGGTPGGLEIPLRIPLPRVTAAAPMGAAAAPIQAHRFHLPWRHTTPEEEAARDAAEQERAALQVRIEQVRREEVQRQTEDLRSLGRGGIPSTAKKRLTELRQADPEQATFTSDLAPDELALLRRGGFRPLGLVSGSAMYHVGTAYASAYNDCEVDVLSKAYQDATHLAVSRMEQEAKALGALGVVGVRFDIVRREWSDKSIEVQLLGTAIAGGEPSNEPWLSDLSGQEWYALHRAGYDPAGLVYGNCTWFILTTQSDEWNERSGTNLELTHFSKALTHCRNNANRQIQDMARRQRAVGVVGMHISRHMEEIRLTGPGENPAYEREHHNLTLSMIGTAIRPRPDAPKLIRGVTHVLSLRDGRLTPKVITTTAAKFE